jgi:acetylornithine deacetylase/succinyl-diaminopimelate desuccinylase-like protein
MDEDFYKLRTGVDRLWGEQGYTPVERTGGRPTLEVNGFYSGFIGEGSKTVLPSYAMAKISTRLVPEQDPDEVQQQLLRYLEESAPPTVRWEVESLACNPATLSDLETPGVQALAQAMETIWGKKPAFKREGGSVPVVGYFQEILGVDSVNTGFALPEDSMHGPNEKTHLPSLYRGIDALILFFFNLAEFA